MEKYKLILLDPPYKYKSRAGRNWKSTSSHHYPTMTLKEICDLAIPDIAQKDSVLFLWVPCPLMLYGIEILKAWKYNYKTKIYWRKIMSLGMGWWFRGQVEELWLAIKGDIKAFRHQKANFIQSKVGRHSQKPEESYQLIEKVAELHNLEPKLELFARKKRPGWDSMGFVVDGKDIRLTL